MTLACNEHCRHCGSSCGDVIMKNQLTNEEIISILKQLKEDLKREGKKLPFLNITGGEPLLRKDFVPLMKTINKMGYNWGMTTNGLLLDDEMVRGIYEAGIYSISISIDGLEKTHDWFRQTKGSYKKAMEAVDKLSKLRLGNLMVTTVVHKQNIDELDELYDIMKKKNINTWRVINVDPIGRAATDDSIRLDTLDYKRIMDFLKENRAKDKNLDLIYGCNHFLGYEYEREVRPWYFLCNAGIYTAGILYNGDISACLDIDRNQPGVIQGNARKDNLYDTWINKFEIYRKDRTVDSKTCKDCKHREECQGEGFHTWDLEKNEPMLCMYNEIEKARKLEEK